VGNSPIDGVPKLGVADRRVERDAGQLAEEPDHLVGGLGQAIEAVGTQAVQRPARDIRAFQKFEFLVVETRA